LRSLTPPLAISAIFEARDHIDLPGAQENAFE
jgi:hypothetical protein